LLVERLYLKNFRNLAAVLLDLNPDLNIILGANGQGKTNILEALYYLSTGKSHRSNRDRDLINQKTEEDKFAIQARIKKKDKIKEKLAVSVSSQEKVYKINDEKKEKLADFQGRLNAVIFSPEDLKLVKGSPSERRDFIDTEVSQVSPNYFRQLQSYKKILRQRNNILKDIRAKKRKKDELLAVFTDKLAKVGSRIIAKRLEVIEKLKILARLQQRRLTANQENLQLKYDISFSEKRADKITESSSDFSEAEIKMIEEIFQEELMSNFQQERERGYTVSGPHRDDLILKLNDFSVRKYGSQGQQRTVALALKISELEFMKSEKGEYPILLLDDVFSELDSRRREAIIKLIGNRIQTFITTTDKSLVADIAPQESSYFKVVSGQVSKGW